MTKLFLCSFLGLLGAALCGGCSSDDTSVDESSGGSAGSSGSGGSAGVPGDLPNDGKHPDGTICTQTRRLVPQRRWVVPPAAVSVLFYAEDCDSAEPLDSLTSADFEVLEDGVALSSEAHRAILDRGQRVVTSLLLDFSDSLAPLRADVVAAAKAFASELLVQRQLSDRVEIGIQLFDGSAAPVTLLVPSSDFATVAAKLDALNTYVPPDGGASNVNGALRQAVTSLQARLDSLVTDNAGGIGATGHVVLFTDGGDTAGRETVSAASATVAAARKVSTSGDSPPLVNSWTVGLRGADYTSEAMTSLMGGPHWVFEADSQAQLAAAFTSLAVRIAKQVESTYLFAFCSTKRAGSHDVSVRIADSRGGSEAVTLSFSAEGFGGGCNADFFTNACADAQCGGLACGACAADTQICNTTSLQCRSNF